jgi:hypothetical protein
MTVLRAHQTTTHYDHGRRCVLTIVMYTTQTCYSMLFMLLMLIH